MTGSLWLTKKTVVLICCAIIMLASNGYSINIARAATFNVSRFDDPDPYLGCNPGNCSLRQAIIAARDIPGSTVILQPGTYAITRPGLDNAVTNEYIGDLDFRVSTSVIGAGVGQTIVQVGTSPYTGFNRVFDNHSLTNVLISKMTIRNGYDAESASGGCIRNLGVLTLESVMVTGCKSPKSGGGISSYHKLDLRNSTITENIAHSSNGLIASGGGLLSGPGPRLGLGSTVNVSGSIISKNIVSSSGDLRNTAFGGGISNNAIMNISNSNISDNTALNNAGIINAKTGTMTILNSSISENKAKYDPGGVGNEHIMTINNSTFSYNIAGFNCIGTQCDWGYAGGIINSDGGVLAITNSTISSNRCTAGGGGILNSAGGGKVNISSCTIVENEGPVGSGIAGSEPIYIKNSIVANNLSGTSGGNLSGYIISQGYNLIQNTDHSYFSGDMSGNIIGEKPKLGNLRLNGGFTATHALNFGSPAKNQANPAGCFDSSGNLLQLDQRGYQRVMFGRCDIGAFEANTPIVNVPVLHLLLHKKED